MGITIQAANVAGRPLRAHIVARRIKKTPRRVRQLAQTGELQGFKTGPKVWAFLPAAVDAYLETQEARRGDL